MAREIEYEEGPGGEPVISKPKPPKKRRITHVNELGWYYFFLAAGVVFSILLGLVIENRQAIWEWIDRISVLFTR